MFLFCFVLQVLEFSQYRTYLKCRSLIFTSSKLLYIHIYLINCLMIICYKTATPEKGYLKWWLPLFLNYDYLYLLDPSVAFLLSSIGTFCNCTGLSQTGEDWTGWIQRKSPEWDGVWHEWGVSWLLADYPREQIWSPGLYKWCETVAVVFDITLLCN